MDMSLGCVAIMIMYQLIVQLLTHNQISFSRTADSTLNTFCDWRGWNMLNFVLLDNGNPALDSD